MPDKEKEGGGLNLSRIEHHGANSGSIAFDDAADSLKSER